MDGTNKDAPAGATEIKYIGVPLFDREVLGRIVRLTWIKWAKEQPNPKPSWLVDWSELSEPDKEVDRRIGENIVGFVDSRLHLMYTENEAIRKELDEARALLKQVGIKYVSTQPNS